MTPKQILEVIMAAVADRTLILITLLLNFILFGYAMMQPSEMRIIIAAAFSLSVFNPILKRRMNNEGTIQRVREEAEGG